MATTITALREKILVGKEHFTKITNFVKKNHHIIHDDDNGIPYAFEIENLKSKNGGWINILYVFNDRYNANDHPIPVIIITANINYGNKLKRRSEDRPSELIKIENYISYAIAVDKIFEVFGDNSIDCENTICNYKELLEIIN